MRNHRPPDHVAGAAIADVVRPGRTTAPSSELCRPMEKPATPRTLVIACGALAAEIRAVIEANGLDAIDVRCVPAGYHNRPERIAPSVQRLIDRARGRYERIFVAYAECGTGGELDRLLGEEKIERLPGAHCYEFYSGREAFAARGDADMRSFFLTDFLARQFDTLVIKGLGLDRHPELRDAYFGHYERVVYLSQAPTPELIGAARAAADRIGLAFEHRHVGYGDLGRVVGEFGSRQSASGNRT
jgi:hypothetical protein